MAKVSVATKLAFVALTVFLLASFTSAQFTTSSPYECSPECGAGFCCGWSDMTAKPDQFVIVSQTCISNVEVKCNVVTCGCQSGTECNEQSGLCE